MWTASLQASDILRVVRQGRPHGVVGDIVRLVSGQTAGYFCLLGSLSKLVRSKECRSCMPVRIFFCMQSMLRVATTRRGDH